MITQRPTTLPQTAELNAIKAQGDQLVAAYHASATLPIERKAGFVVCLSIDDQPYTITAACECPAEQIVVYNDPRADDPPGERTVNLVCARHGQQRTLALQAQAVHYNKAAFAWVEQRHARDRRVQWGMARPSLPSPSGRGARGEGGGQS